MSNTTATEAKPLTAEHRRRVIRALAEINAYLTRDMRRSNEVRNEALEATYRAHAAVLEGMLK